jgi:DNA-binding transcriptional LysR family regulator
MRIRQVEAFKAVMDTGSVTAAATALHISQPSVSRLIADLETAVGFALFERRGGRVVPTAQARAFEIAVRRSFAGIELLEGAARRIRAQPVDVVRVAALAALASAVLPPALQKFRAAYPDVKITIEALSQREIEDRIFFGQADLGLGVAVDSRAGLRASPLVEAAYIAALPARHRLAPRRSLRIADLDGETLIGPMHEADALWFGIDRALQDAGITVQRPIESQHSLPVYACVAAGLGLAIAEPFSASLFARAGVVVRRLSPRIAVPFAVLEPDIGVTSAPAAALRAAVIVAANARLAEVDGLTRRSG